MLSWGIPSYRLPRTILDKEIDDIRKLGVEIKCGIRVGRDLPWDAVNKDFDFVYLAPGAHKSQKMGVEGEDLNGVWGGVEFLRDYNGRRGSLEKRQEEPRLEGGRHRRRQLRHRRGPDGPAPGRRGDDPLPAPARGHARRSRGDRRRRTRGREDRVPHGPEEDRRATAARPSGSCASA